MPDLHYTGHPLFDIGLAAIVAHADKTRPEELEIQDLERAARFIIDHYTQPPLTSFLSAVFMNSGFTQPAYTLAQRQNYARLVTGGYRPDIPKSNERCVFTGKPALGVVLSINEKKAEQTPVGRAFRQHIPLLTGVNVMNFSPGGNPGLPVSGEALLCLQFAPMGCRKCGGKLLAIHSDNAALLFAAAHDALRENIEALSFARATDAKLRDASPSAPSMLIETIVDLTREQNRAKRKKAAYSVTAYHLSNSGQASPLDEKNPPLKIYHLPMRMIRFLQAALDDDYQGAWQRLVARGQAFQKRSSDAQKKPVQEKETKRAALAPRRPRNFFYEDLFRLPEDAIPFLRKYFLPSRDQISSLLNGHESEEEATDRQKRSVPPWPFVALFLLEVLHMDKERIQQIRELGDILAAYVHESGDQRFFQQFYQLQQTYFFRNELLRAAKKAAAQKNLLFRYDTFCTVFFTEDGETLRFDWKLVRDLLFIRMLEWLYDKDEKVGELASALPEERTDEDSSTQE